MGRVGASGSDSMAIVVGMCRSIRTLRHADVIATDAEIREAARQFVRKVSGFSKPSSRHEAAFQEAVDEITVASQRLLGSIAGNLAGAGARSRVVPLQQGLVLVFGEHGRCHRQGEGKRETADHGGSGKVWS